MKVPLGWLKEYVDIDMPLNELAETLTMAGTETAVVRTGAQWPGIIIGQIEEINPHPNADRLKLVTINLGSENKPIVVCGAPNLTIGTKVAFASPGVEIIDAQTGEQVILKPAIIRGIESKGMILSERELGISDNHTGILILTEGATIGSRLADLLTETIIDLEVTPNRPDLLSVIGIAREIGGLTVNTARIQQPDYEAKGKSIIEQIEVIIEEPNLCPRYTCSLIKGIEIGESPEWLKKRLLACGMRPINNIVDVTNYVMLEYGQPLHAFDYDKLSGKKIIIRRAQEGEKFVTLDGIERTLGNQSIMINDAEHAVAIGGVMGGLNSEVDGKTSNILIESANFYAPSIHFTSRNLELESEASTRFERCLSPELAAPALRRATELMAKLAGGEVAEGIVDEYPGKPRHKKAITVNEDRIKNLLGTNVTIGKVGQSLRAMGITWIMNTLDEEEYGGSYDTTEYWVYPPFWRTDLNLEVDIIEEVGRLIGYDNIPLQMMPHALPQHQIEPMFAFKRRVRSIMAGYGFHEIISYSMTSVEKMASIKTGKSVLEPIAFNNPLTTQQTHLRTSLRADLLDTLSSNRRHEEGSIRLFELGRIYLKRPQDYPLEPEILAGLIASASAGNTQSADHTMYDFWSVKGIVESLLLTMNLKTDFNISKDSGLKANIQAIFSVKGKEVGIVGEIHPRVLERFDISEPIYVFEINLSRLMKLSINQTDYKAIPRYPAVYRDIALVVDQDITNKEIVDIISKFSLVAHVNMFDLFTGKQVGEGKTSLAYNIAFQANDRTLTDEEVDAIIVSILNQLKTELGAELRS